MRMLLMRARVGSLPFPFRFEADDLGKGCRDRPFVPLKRSVGRCKRLSAVPAVDGTALVVASGAAMRLVTGDDTLGFGNLEEGDAIPRGIPRAAAGDSTAGNSLTTRPGLAAVGRPSFPGVPPIVSVTRAIAG